MFDEFQPVRTSRNLSPTSSCYNSYQKKRTKLTPACEVLIKEDKPNEIHISDDYYDLIGRLWASKLRKLPENIQPLAEKVVNDTFFDFQMGKFTVPDANHSVQSDKIQSTIQSTSRCVSRNNLQFQLDNQTIASNKCCSNSVVSTSKDQSSFGNYKRPFSR